MNTWMLILTLYLIWTIVAIVHYIASRGRKTTLMDKIMWPPVYLLAMIVGLIERFILRR